MAYRLVLMITCLLPAGTLLGAVDSDLLGTVVMNRDVYVSDSGEEDLPRVKAGEVLPCPGETGGGYLVVCRDSANSLRLGFLPYRTEWGHVTAKSWKHDAAMGPNTIVVRAPMTLKQGAIPLLEGEEYEVIAKGKKKYTVRYVFAGLTRAVPVLAEDVSFTPVSARTGPPPAPSREEVLEKDIARAEAMQKQLLEKLAEAEAKRKNLGILLEKLRFIEMDNAQLLAEVARSTETYRELVKWSGPDDGVMDGLKEELKKLIERQAGLSARIKKAQLEAEPLQLVFAQLRMAENEAEELKLKVAKEEAVAAGLYANADNEIVRQGRNRIKMLLEDAARKNASLTKAIVRMESGKQDVVSLVAMLEAAKAENAALDKQVKALSTELSQLRKKMGPPKKPLLKKKDKGAVDRDDAKMQEEAAARKEARLQKIQEIKKALAQPKREELAPAPVKTPPLAPAPPQIVAPKLEKAPPPPPEPEAPTDIPEEG